MSAQVFKNPPESDKIYTVPECSGASFPLKAGQKLTVIDPQGSQVSDLLTINANDLGDILSNGRTFDFNNKIFLTTGDALWSNRSNVMLRIVEDTVGTHDFLYTPCSAEMFRITYGVQEPRPGCLGNLAEALEPFGFSKDHVPVAFNCFMNVSVDGNTGEVKVLPPKSKAGDFMVFRAEMDLIVALTACSAERTNAGVLKPIQFKISN